MCGLGVQSCRSFASSGWLFLSSVYLQHLRKIFTLRNTRYLLPPSSCHLAGNQNLIEISNIFLFSLKTDNTKRNYSSNLHIHV
jgi:hypothetical protein